MTEDNELISYLLLLRFGTKEPSLQAAPILNYASIAKTVRKPLQTVRRLILLGLQAIKENNVIQ